MSERFVDLSDLAIPRLILEADIVMSAVDRDLARPQVRAALAERWSVDESAVTPRMHPMLAAPTTQGAIVFARLCRDSVLYAVDFEEANTAMSGDWVPLGTLDLPPLPFPRIAIEAIQNITWKMLAPDDTPLIEVEAIQITETERGKEWDVTLYARLPMDEGWEQDADDPIDTGVRPMLFRITADHVELIDYRGKAEQRNEEGFIQLAWQMPVKLVHFLTAVGVEHTAGTPSRQVRRAFERQTEGRVPHPTIYLVHVSEHAGDHPGGGPKSDRSYSVRWLVRGHWRTLASGNTTWVRAHVKGPAGAPFKGRPIYVK
jgi:hypothetical protein